jgi:hypothetical protein
MITAHTFGPMEKLIRRLASSAFLAILATVGLVMVPVSCTCGAPLPHAHSLFELPFHHHAHDDGRYHVDQDDHDHHGHASAVAFATPELALLGDEVMCDSLKRGNTTGFNVAASNALEQHEGATLQAPPTSSVGHAIAMTTPALVTIAEPLCETLLLPPARVLKGSTPLPETPPPQHLAIA